MSWFGKLTFGSLGMVLGGPLGAIAGAVFGHAFDSAPDGAANQLAHYRHAQHLTFKSG